MAIIYIAVGTFVTLIFLIKRELLIEKESFRIILGASILLFIIGAVLHFIDPGPYELSSVLLCPLPSLLLFRLLRKLFVKWFKHEPRDTFNNWEAGLGEDRIFNIVYGTLAFILLILAISSMRALIKVGW